MLSNADPVKRYLRKIDKLAGQLLGADFGGPQGLWDFQEQLMAIQREIQQSITAAKKSLRDSAQHAQLEDLRVARWNARRLGDAFAWIVLGNDIKTIVPLTENHKVPITSDDHGSRGAIAIASHLAGEGWGFPLLHDVTDCLRIGDVTFVRPGDVGREIQTVEVKTRLEQRVGGEDGTATETLNVSVIYPLNPPMPSDEQGSVKSFAPTPTPENKAREARVDRQLARMTKAEAKRNAPEGLSVDADGQGSISTTIEGSTESHWPTLRRLIRRARTRGHATETVENTFLYEVFYSPDGFSAEMLEKFDIADDVIQSGIFIEDRKDLNSLIISQIPGREGRGAYRCLPYFLYPIPKTAISDLLHGRLTIIVIVNPGRIVEALERGGFSVSSPPNKNIMEGDELVLTVREKDPQDIAYIIELHGLGYYFEELVHEFKSVDHLLLMANGMRAAAVSNLGKATELESGV